MVIKQNSLLYKKKRRIGKTYLINQTFKDKFLFKHTALSPDGDIDIVLSLQLEKFYDNLIKYGLEKCDKPTNWFKAFDLLEKLIIQNMMEIDK